MADAAVASSLPSRLQRREEERQADRDRRKQEKGDVSASESADFFRSSFTKAREEIAEGLGSLVAGSPNVADELDALAVKLQDLQKFLAESTLFLPTFDIRSSQEHITALQNALAARREELVPKKKFAFKSRKASSDAAAATPRTESPAVPQPETRARVAIELPGFSGRTGETLTKRPGELGGSDFALSRLTGCHVALMDVASAVHIDKLTDCVVLIGPVSGSVFIDGCTNTTFVVACHQLRIHTTQRCDFYIHVATRAIIEDCHAVRFAPYAWTYPEYDAQFEASRLDRNKNSWDDIDDFKWLKPDQPSPNWSLVPKEERRTFAGAFE